MAITRRAVLRGALVAGTGALAGTGAYGYAYERHELEVTRATVPVTGLPPALAGLRIGLITDIHRSLFVSHEDVARAATMMMTERPDLIVLGGDYVTYGDRNYVRPPPTRSPRSPRRTACSASSATTTTTTTCRPRSPATACRC